MHASAQGGCGEEQATNLRLAHVGVEHGDKGLDGARLRNGELVVLVCCTNAPCMHTSAPVLANHKGGASHKPASKQEAASSWRGAPPPQDLPLQAARGAQPQAARGAELQGRRQARGASPDTPGDKTDPQGSKGRQRPRPAPWGRQAAAASPRARWRRSAP
jgi:hypothetical protein